MAGNTRGKVYHKKRTYTKKKVSKSKRMPSETALVKLIKTINIKQSETKYRSKAFTWSALQHDNIYKVDLWNGSDSSLFPGQGTTDGNRIGDRIVSQGIKLRIAFDVPWDRKNVKLKLFYLTYNSDQGDPTTYSNFFHNITGNARLDPIQKKRYGGLKYLGTYQIEPERAPYYTYSTGDQTPNSDVISTNTGTICVKKWLSMEKNLFFRSDGTTQPSNLKEIGTIIAIPYASINTSSGSAVTSGDVVILNGEMSATVYYKDL